VIVPWGNEIVPAGAASKNVYDSRHLRRIRTWLLNLQHCALPFLWVKAALDATEQYVDKHNPRDPRFVK
jgi:hypothetical protein